MNDMKDVLQLALTHAVVRIYFGVMNTTEVEVLIGLDYGAQFGRYCFELRGDTLKPPTTHLHLLDSHQAKELSHEWTHGGGRHSAPDDFRWLKNDPFIATSVGSNGFGSSNSGVLGPYHETCQQLLAMLIVQMMNERALAEEAEEKQFYNTALLRLRSLANKINERQSEHGAYPRLLFAKDRDTEI